MSNRFLILSLSLLITIGLAYYHVKANSTDEISGASAHWVSVDRLIWDVPSITEKIEIRYSQNADIRVSNGSVENGTVIQVGEEAELNDDLADAFRHIADRSTFEVDVELEVIREAVKGQLVALAFDSRGRVIDATRVQFPGLIDDTMIYNGLLGPIYHDSGISLAVWAPTAQELRLKLYDADKNHIQTVEASSNNEETGVWYFKGTHEWDRTFYRFEVQVYHHINNQINTFVVTDPYSVSLSTDSRYSQFADLANDESLKPDGWDNLRKVLPAPTDITLYEAHVRDFSFFDETVPDEHRGTYLAFTYNGQNGRALSAGMEHLIRLSNAGLSHLHLLPVNDIATVIEDQEERVDLHHPYNRLCDFIENERLEQECEEFGDTPIIEVFEMLAEQNPVTDRIQLPYNEPGRFSGMAGRDGFNWGYDPFHFNAPEGSYSTNPDGTERILELRQMVQALAEIGLYVVIDVVYNHTFDSGLSRFSVLDKIVPGYYHRYDVDNGLIETSTCCDNTAAEHYMMEKLLIDSVILWAKYYKIDSFRFDLMGHHPRYVMENLQEALAEYNIDDHGFEGHAIYIYGEGWNFGEVANNRIFDQATQFNMGGTGIGNFNDRMRDGIRGGNFTDRGRFQGFVSGMYLFPNEDASANPDENLGHLLYDADRIRVGLAGNLSTYPYINRLGELVTGGNEMIGFTLMPQETVNYIDKHDNETFWDNTQTKLPMDMSMDDRARIHLLGNAFINFGQGVPFYQMGSDILRSKSLDRNSFDSGDWFNRVDFSLDTHNWGTGLPPGWDNANRWDDMVPFLTSDVIHVEKNHMEFAHEVFLDQLRVRYSSPLFRMENPRDIHHRLAFHNTGPDQIPGIIAMTISDVGCVNQPYDVNYDGIVVVFNDKDEATEIELGIWGAKLHPVLANGSDPIVKEAREENGVYFIPAHTAAVFVMPAGTSNGNFPCNELKAN